MITTDNGHSLFSTVNKVTHINLIFTFDNYLSSQVPHKTRSAIVNPSQKKGIYTLSKIVWHSCRWRVTDEGKFIQTINL